jgi:alkyl hydroperoxide reductase subunit AhpC
VSLDQFKGKWVVLYFYPKDVTPGCTVEAKPAPIITILFIDFLIL